MHTIEFWKLKKSFKFKVRFAIEIQMIKLELVSLFIDEPKFLRTPLH